MWLRAFLSEVPHYYFTLPWDSSVPLISEETTLMQAWLWLYLIFSMVVGQLIRNGFKYISWSDQWKALREKIMPTNYVK